jgi:hypothetical protein
MKVEQILEMSVVIHTISTYKNCFCSSVYGCEKCFPILREKQAGSFGKTIRKILDLRGLK